MCAMSEMTGIRATPEGRVGEPTGRRRVPTTPGEGTIRITWRRDGTTHEATGDDALARLPALLATPEPAVWIDLASPGPDQVEHVGRILGLHPLIVEDVLEGDQRPKLEETESILHLILFDLVYEDGIISTEIDFILGPRYLLTVHDARWDPRSLGHLRGRTDEVLARGLDHLLWALTDGVVDGYFPFADRLGDAIDELQDDVMRGPSPAVLDRLFALKRDLHDVRRSVSPVRDVFNQLTNRDLPFIDADEFVYFRDVYDHVIRLTDELDNYREMTSATLDVYLTQVNNGLSVIMKRLTGVTVILAGVGAVAGIFGMSEAGTVLTGGEPTGFWLVVGTTFLVAVVALAVLRRIDWI
jgi:magnesium transporter